MIKHLNHVGLSVRRLDESIRFYRDLLGMELITRQAFGGHLYERILNLPRARGEVALLQCDSARIELFHFFVPCSSEKNERRISDHGISHFCVEVADIDAAYSKMKAAGVYFHCEPIEFFGRVKATYGRDPD